MKIRKKLTLACVLASIDKPPSYSMLEKRVAGAAKGRCDQDSRRKLGKDPPSI
jgi:hypothetical protein